MVLWKHAYVNVSNCFSFFSFKNRSWIFFSFCLRVIIWNIFFFIRIQLGNPGAWKNMSTSAPLLCSGKTTDNKKRRKTKKKRKTKKSRKQKIWFMVYKLPKSNTSEKRQKFIGVGLLVEQIIQWMYVRISCAFIFKIKKINFYHWLFVLYQFHILVYICIQTIQLHRY